ncbi:MAG: Uma2 family endonuclease [Acidobacteriota bacterium]|nr:Uma2 family endonuclease [Acidobacteriota bacterium]
MQVVLKNIESQSTIRIQPERRMTDDEYYNFCCANSDLRIERTAEGEIVIMPPTGGETGYRNSDLTGQLRDWARRDGRGRAFDSNTEFFLPNGAARAPDASWVLRSRLEAFTKQQKRKFLPLCPDFVVELTSPSDRLSQVRAKMREWIDNGAQLGWLLDADKRTAYIFKPGQDPVRIVNASELIGEDPVAGFRLELHDIWEGL